MTFLLAVGRICLCVSCGVGITFGRASTTRRCRCHARVDGSGVDTGSPVIESARVSFPVLVVFEVAQLVGDHQTDSPRGTGRHRLPACTSRYIHVCVRTKHIYDHGISGKSNDQYQSHHEESEGAAGKQQRHCCTQAYLRCNEAQVRLLSCHAEFLCEN